MEDNDMAIQRPCSPWVPYYAPAKAYNGYTLFTPEKGAVIWLIDMEGRFVHCWEVPSMGEAGKLLSNGNLLCLRRDVTARTARVDASGGELVEMDWDSNVVWRYEDQYMHHDFCRMDNGNVMILRRVPMPDDIAARVQGGIPGTDRDVMWTDSFREVTPYGKVVWEWLGYEHLDPEVDIINAMCPRGEWTHTNACSVLPYGDILTTLRHIDTIAIIDKGTGDIKWRWGVGELSMPHSPSLLNNGNILVFDNGNFRKRAHQSYSRVVEVNPNTGEIEWEYKDDPPYRFYSHFKSDCQRLPNENTLICETTKGRLFEVTPGKEVVWEYISPFYVWTKEAGWNNMVGRISRYGPDYEGLKGRKLDPDRLELTLREKPQGKEQARLERLHRLGY